MIRITKTYTFCYGHRLWNQQTAPYTCRRLHGHSGAADITLAGPRTVRGMLVDFNELKSIKVWIDEVIDHRFLIGLEDPLLKTWMETLRLNESHLIECAAGHWELPRSLQTYGVDFLTEWAQSLVVVPWEPTSENLAGWLFGVVHGKLRKIPAALESGCEVMSVRWWESETSFAEYVK